MAVAVALPETDALADEMAGSRVKVTLSANETFGGWRERDHDDLVLAVALACWLAEQVVRSTPAQHQGDVNPTDGRLVGGPGLPALAVAIAAWLGERCCRRLAFGLCWLQTARSVRFLRRSADADVRLKLLRRAGPEQVA